MQKPSIPSNEEARLEALSSYRVLDTADEECFDQLTQLASEICQTPIALVSLIDGKRQWFKSRVGLEAKETPRELAFCAHAIHNEELFVIPDSSKDERFFDNPLVTGAPYVRFYAGAPLYNKDGFALGTLCIIDNHPREISQSQKEALEILGRQVVAQLELRRSLRILESQNAELKQFTHVVSNDLRTPLRGIVSLVEWINEDLFGDKIQEAKSSLGLLLPKIRRMQRLVEGVLTYSKVSKRAPQKQNVPLSQILPGITQNVCDDSRFTFEIPDNLPTLSADPVQIETLFTSLLSNAVQHHNKGAGIIKISFKDLPLEYQFSVSDDGPGINQIHHTKIFELFETVQDANETDTTGLGLAIAKKIVEDRGGKIWVESSPGNGARFSFIWPRE